MSDRPADQGNAASRDALRRRIAAEAARGVTRGSDAKRAVFRAARRLARGWVPPDGLPTPAEVQADVRMQLGPARRPGGDRFDRIASLVGVLSTVKRDPAMHPEGDALEHALQVFELVHVERPYDEELLTAALVRDVGLTIDRDAPIAAGLEALGDTVTPRTRWLVESLAAARAHAEGTLGHRARRRLEAHPDFEAVLLLAGAERRGCVRGGVAPSLDDALAILRDLDREEPDAPT